LRRFLFYVIDGATFIERTMADQTQKNPSSSGGRRTAIVTGAASWHNRYADVRKAQTQDSLARLAETCAFGRFATAEESAEITVWFTRPETSHVTGRIFD
jgi:hypothetical protein